MLDSKNITFQTAVEIADSCESADAGVKSLHIGVVIKLDHCLS